MLVLEDSFVVGLNDACGVWHAAVADLANNSDVQTIVFNDSRHNVDYKNGWIIECNQSSDDCLA